MLVREALKGKPNPAGKNQYTQDDGDASGSNTPKTSASDRGRARTLDRLKREKPELFQQVSEGQLSANACSCLVVLPVRAWEKVPGVKYGWDGLRV